MTKTHSGALALFGLMTLVVAVSLVGWMSAFASQTTPTVPTYSPGAAGNASTTNLTVSASSLFSGVVGVGTSSPFARFSLQANTSDTYYGVLVNISSSSPTATTTLFQVDTQGNTFHAGTISSGSSTPFATLVAQAASSSVLQALFAVASTSNNGSVTTPFRITNTGDIITRGTVPLLGSCGGAAITATSTDMRGTISVSSGTPTTCNITFSSVKSDTPTCIVSDNSVALAVGVLQASTTGAQFGMGVTFSGNLFYHCLQ